MPLPRVDYDIETLRGDVAGGVTAAVVSLPFALAFGVASGMGAAAGLYGSIAVGFFAAVFGGSRAVISGPVPAVTIAMSVIVASHATSLSEALVIVVMGGLLQILLGLAGIGRFVVYTPHVVVAGIMSGIGIIVVLAQVAPLLGSPVVLGGAVASLQALPDTLLDTNANALIVGAVTLTVMVFWPAALDRRLPRALVALLAGTLLGVLWFPDAPTLGPIPDGLPTPSLVLPSTEFLLRSLEPAVILALLASVESLLTSLVVDSLTGSRHDSNRELIGQGIANTVAGVVGGLPGAGAPASSATSIRSGGRTRASGVLRAAALLALLLGLGGLVEPIPHAVLAAILIKVGWDLVDWQLLARVRYLRREHLIVVVSAICLTVFVDLITAGAIGLIMAGMAHARQLERIEQDSVTSLPLRDRSFFADDETLASTDSYSARVGLLALKGGFTVASSRRLIDAVGADIRQHEVVILDFSDTTYLDDSAARLIGQLLDVAEEDGTECVVVGLSEEIERTLFAFGVLRRVPQDRLVETMDAARQVARELLRH